MVGLCSVFQYVGMYSVCYKCTNVCYLNWNMKYWWRQSDGQMDKWMDIGECRVAFATENRPFFRLIRCKEINKM